MRTVFKLWLAMITLAGGQELKPDEISYIRLVNAVAPGEGRVELILNGAIVYPEGYQLGAVTGGIGVARGRCKVLVRKDGVKEGESRFDVRAGKTITLIPFAERVPANEDGPAHWQIRILRLKQTEKPKGREATFVSVARAPNVSIEMRDPAGNWDRHFVQRFQITRAPMKYPEGYVPLRMGDRELPSIPVMDEGNYVVVLFDDADGKLGALSFRDFRHVTAE